MYKTPLVLVPGIGCSRDSFKEQIAALSSVAECWVAPLYAEDCLERLSDRILDDCPFDQFFVTGFSMGGYLCLELCRRAPARVMGMALIGTMPNPDSIDLSKKRLLMNRDILNGKWGTMWNGIVRKCVAPSRRSDTAIIGTIASHVAQTSPDTFLKHQEALSKRLGYVDFLPKIKCPTVVIAGIDDEVISLRTQVEMQTEIPHAHLVGIKDCGHLPTWEQPERLSAALYEWIGFFGVEAA